MSKHRLSQEKSDKVEQKFIRFDRKLGKIWSRFWACLLFVPSIPMAKTAIVMALQGEWPSVAICVVGASVCGGLAVLLWRRSNRYGLVDILAERDHPKTTPKR